MFGPDFLDFEFQIKESGFILYSLESPTGSMVQKGNFDVLWMRKGTKDYLGIKRDILKVEGKERSNLNHCRITTNNRFVQSYFQSHWSRFGC